MDPWLIFHRYLTFLCLATCTVGPSRASLAEFFLSCSHDFCRHITWNVLSKVWSTTLSTYYSTFEAFSFYYSFEDASAFAAYSFGIPNIFGLF